MPEVKWVERDALLDNDDKPHYAKARQQNMIPVLTLDQIEAWMEKNAPSCNCPHSDINSSQEYDRHHARWCSTVHHNGLLAQVREWKEGIGGCQ